MHFPFSLFAFTWWPVALRSHADLTGFANCIEQSRQIRECRFTGLTAPTAQLLNRRLNVEEVPRR